MDDAIDIQVLPHDALTPDVAPVEIVERKGVGHPDSLCDGVAEALAVALARHYREQTGGLLHFNLDKILLVAGTVERDFGSGHWVQPMRLFVGDRATARWRGRDLGLPALLQARASAYFATVLPALDVHSGLQVIPVTGPGAAELSSLFDEHQPVRANDTSAVVGYAPLSPVELLVLRLERHLQNAAFKRRHPATGQDVKIMAVRRGTAVDLTVAMPMLATQVASAAAYRAAREAARVELQAEARRLLPEDWTPTIALNALDDDSQGAAGVYLTLCGTSAEHGDSGEVGRGNRVHGVIPLMRPGGAEAVAGKNPRCHVGKIYSVLAFQMARALLREVPTLRAAQIWLTARIGAPLDQPASVVLQCVPMRGSDLAQCDARMRHCVQAQLRAIADLCRELEGGAHTVF